jgi:hypothetical protein
LAHWRRLRRAVTLRLKDNDIKPMPFNEANESHGKTKDGQLDFANRRAETWWRFHEALDPDQPDGAVIALPPDPEAQDRPMHSELEIDGSRHPTRKQR